MELDYGFWWDVSDYANKAWKGAFNAKEVAETALDLYTEWIADKFSIVVTAMAEALKEDVLNGNEKALEYYVAIKSQQTK